LLGNTTDFEDVLFELVAVDATCNSDYCTGLACTWRTVEEEMRNAVLLDKLFDWANVNERQVWAKVDYLSR
jgi:hypothetical protein